jgi:hypothetical protein
MREGAFATARLLFCVSLGVRVALIVVKWRC